MPERNPSEHIDDDWPCDCPDCQTAPQGGDAPADATPQAAPSDDPALAVVRSDHGTYDAFTGHLVPGELAARDWDWRAEEHGPVGATQAEWTAANQNARHWLLPPPGGWTYAAVMHRISEIRGTRLGWGRADTALCCISQRVADLWEPAWPDVMDSGATLRVRQEIRDHYNGNGAPQTISYERMQALNEIASRRRDQWRDAQPFACDHCGDETRYGDTTAADGSRVCGTCLAEHYARCARCDRWHAAQDSHDVILGNPRRTVAYCPDCYDDTHAECVNCGCTVSGVGVVGASQWMALAGRSWPDVCCVDCGNDWAERCDSCQSAIHPDDWVEDEDDEDAILCRSCAHDRERITREIDLDDRGASPIRSYSNKRSSRLKPLGKRRAGEHYFGVELETVVRTNSSEGLWRTGRAILRSIGQDFATLKEDGSLGGTGIEIVSARATMAEHRKRWATICDDERPDLLVAYDDNRCGLHVHVGRERLSKLQIGRIVQFVNDPSNEPLVVSVAQRDKNSYCRRYEKPLKRRRQGTSAVGRPHYDTPPATEAYDRYDAINLCNEHTIEFRIFRATLRYASLVKSLDFVDALVRFCGPAGASFDELTTKSFLVWLRGRKLDYPYLWAWLASPARGFVRDSKRVKQLIGAAAAHGEV